MIQGLYNFAKEWSKNGSIYIISDTHFLDKDRSFMGYNISSEEQLSYLMRICHKQDTLIHLGDIGDVSFIDRLNCYKILIVGNHDVSNQFTHFNEVYKGPLTISQKIILSHEPINVTCLEQNCMLNIHGHNHNGPIYLDDYHVNLASNVIGYRPISLKTIIQSGLTKKVNTIHRITIDRATEDMNS